MKPKCSLPVLLVSACDRRTAEEFVSELVDNEVTETEGEVEEGAGRVWRLVNKYYSADVLVRARGDTDPHSERVEAHVAYFTHEECEASTEAAATCAEARTGAAPAAVRVAALRATDEGEVGAAAARARYEPVPLTAAAEDEGLARVRAALHAHVWPGLRRLDRAAPTLSYRDSDESSSCGEEGEDGDEADEDEEGAVERAEQFALALGALRAAGGAGGLAADLGLEERRERAEQLLAALCRALGDPLDC